MGRGPVLTPAERLLGRLIRDGVLVIGSTGASDALNLAPGSGRIRLSATEEDLICRLVPEWEHDDQEVAVERPALAATGPPAFVVSPFTSLVHEVRSDSPMETRCGRPVHPSWRRVDTTGAAKCCAVCVQANDRAAS